ncbi:DUF4394 domain-containing protein [Massilia sp. IC2-477]|uniref:DUF4394 domain-containing protein n=1 Tax=Massilia sp. IC2-477 TaxID=2887198 RepID=UPI001D10D2A5|nr:DUF4394 domain-containing protein [Massilia sp. IC2-477]MCC2955601.1 DUF4394 domain-containing protein [Massilia sp. IC2-477]
MNKRIPGLLLASTLAFVLAGCGGDDDPVASVPVTTPPPTAVTAGDLVVLTTGNRLVSFNRDTPGTARTSAAVTGLQAGESLVGIDYRPADGQLYGVGSSGRIYTLNPETGAASLKATLSADAADTTAPYTALGGSEFGVDFNPVADRLRVVSNTGQSLRINVDTGATTTDGSINGGAAGSTITASAYTNSFAGTTSTTLYALDSATDTLYVQNPPNDGTLATPVSLGLDAGAANGFDIDARTNMGYVVVNAGGTRTLYTVNLGATANAATAAGALALSEDARGLALRAGPAPVVLALTDAGRIVAFRPATPNVLTADIGLAGLNANETVVGFDIRPRDGLLYGITSAARIVTIDAATGVTTVKATLAADPADTTLPFTGIVGSMFAVDFNPVADRLRVISDRGQSLRINVDTGATTTDGAINRAGAAPVVTGAAYTNSIPSATATQLFDIDTDSDSLALQNPPNEGTLVNVGMLGVAVAGDAAFDIAGGANGIALAALRTTAGGPSSLYRIDLASGAATLVAGSAAPATSVAGAGLGLRDIAISLR